MNPSLYIHAIKLLSDCSIPPQLTGFTFLLEAVIMKSENYTIKLKNIYKNLAQKYCSTHRAVARSISYAITQSDNIRDYLSVGTNDLFNGKIIALLALRLKTMCQDDQPAVNSIPVPLVKRI